MVYIKWELINQILFVGNTEWQSMWTIHILCKTERQCLKWRCQGLKITQELHHVLSYIFRTYKACLEAGGLYSLGMLWNKRCWMPGEMWSINTWWRWAWYVIEFLQHPPCCDWRLKACYIQGVTGGTDQTSGGCSLCETIPKKPKTPISKVERFGR